ncbi:unnamed protein product, partial [Discosporangium mesarthrocarpum]
PSACYHVLAPAEFVSEERKGTDGVSANDGVDDNCWADGEGRKATGVLRGIERELSKEREALAQEVSALWWEREAMLEKHEALEAVVRRQVEEADSLKGIVSELESKFSNAMRSCRALRREVLLQTSARRDLEMRAVAAEMSLKESTQKCSRIEKARLHLAARLTSVTRQTSRGGKGSSRHSNMSPPAGAPSSRVCREVICTTCGKSK